MDTARQLQEFCKKLGYQTVTPQKELAKKLNFSLEEPGRPPQCAVVIGGDGTLLGAARHYAPLGVPILGVNLGHLGFLTEVEVSSFAEALHRVVKGEYTLDERRMLSVNLCRDGQTIGTYLALNDMVVTRGTFARIITIDVLISGHKADRYRADGIIVASPTGSTAYSLAAGGPVVDPKAEVLVITPICPHSLRGRVMVVPDQEQVEIKVIHGGGEIMLTVDGQVGCPLKPGDVVEVVRSKHTTKLIRLAQRYFYDLFRSRIGGKCEEDEGEGEASQANSGTGGK